jgi:hypothetical protein
MTEPSIGSRHRSARRYAWSSHLLWVACALLTSAFLLRYARNLRIADLKGAGQYHAVRDAVSPASGAPDRWTLFLSDADDQRETLATLCTSIERLSRSGHEVVVTWLDEASVMQAEHACPGVQAAATDSAGTRQVATLMRQSHLRVLLVDESGRYVFGDADVASGLRVLRLFARSS